MRLITKAHLVSDTGHGQGLFLHHFHRIKDFRYLKKDMGLIPSNPFTLVGS